MDMDGSRTENRREAKKMMLMQVIKNISQIGILFNLSADGSSGAFTHRVDAEYRSRQAVGLVVVVEDRLDFDDSDKS
jgi:hypothetical protein